MLKFVLVLTGLAVSFWAQATTLEDFRRDMQDHRVRVQNYATLMIEKYPQHFPALHKLTPFDRKRIVRAYLVLHDMPKVMKFDQLKKFNWGFNRAILDELFDHYGENCRPVCVNEMNRIEAELKQKVMLKDYGYLGSEILERILTELKLAEEVADVTDTKMNRSKELGFVKEPRAAEAYFLELSQEPAAEMSLWIERQHDGASLRLCRRVVETTK